MLFILSGLTAPFAQAVFKVFVRGLQTQSHESDTDSDDEPRIVFLGNQLSKPTRWQALRKRIGARRAPQLQLECELE